MLKKIVNGFFYFTLFIYVCLMIMLFFRPEMLFTSERIIHRSINIIPFATILEYINSAGKISLGLVVDNIVGNVVVFIPFGLYLQIFRKKKTIWKSVGVLALASIFIEIIQWVLGVGVSDIDDILLNTLGGLIGVLLYMVLLKISRSERRAENIVKALSIIVGVPIFVIAVLTILYNL